MHVTVPRANSLSVRVCSPVGMMGREVGGGGGLIEWKRWGKEGREQLMISASLPACRDGGGGRSK